MYMN